MQKSIAFFDFDGTITRRDTLLELAKFAKGAPVFYVKMISILPWLLGMKAGIVKHEKAKEKMLQAFYQNMNINKFNALCEAFCSEVLPGLIRPSALKKIELFKEKNIPVFVVTASAENWVAPWCHKNNIGLIATKLEINDNKITGNLIGVNCNNEEKACRIKNEIDLSVYEEIYAFGDTKGDEAMLSLATHPFYRLFTD